MLSLVVRFVSRGVALLLQATAWVSALFIMVAVPADVVSRNVIGESISGVVEMTQFALVALVAAGLALAQRDRLHIETDLVTSRLRPAVARRVTRAARIVCLGTTALIAVASCVAAFDSYLNAERSLGTFRMPIWPSRAVLAFGFVTLTAYLVHEVARPRRQQGESTSDDEDVDVPMSAV